MVIPLMSELLEQTENYNQWNNHERPAASSSVLLFVFDTNWFNLIEKKYSRSYRSNKSDFFYSWWIYCFPMCLIIIWILYQNRGLNCQCRFLSVIACPDSHRKHTGQAQTSPYYIYKFYLYTWLINFTNIQIYTEFKIWLKWTKK